MRAYTEESGYSPNTVAVRGGGDIATGVIQKLWHAGFNVLVLETAFPLTIRRTVALSSAVSEKVYRVEDMTAALIASPGECAARWQSGIIPVLVDPWAGCLDVVRPFAVVDAIIAKRNMGTCRAMAPVTIALGPGFSAPANVDCVIETMRGHYLGSIITNGAAIPNTATPGALGGKTYERVIHAPASGVIRHIRALGDAVEKGEPVFAIDDVMVPASLTGTLRGLIAEGLNVRKGLKCADIDPRPAGEVDCYTISDKARAIGGGVLEACFIKAREKNIALLRARAASPRGCFKINAARERSHFFSLQGARRKLDEGVLNIR